MKTWQDFGARLRSWESRAASPVRRSKRAGSHVVPRAHSRVFRKVRYPAVNRWSKDVVGSSPSPRASPTMHVDAGPPLYVGHSRVRSPPSAPCPCSSKAEHLFRTQEDSIRFRARAPCALRLVVWIPDFHPGGASSILAGRASCMSPSSRWPRTPDSQFGNGGSNPPGDTMGRELVWS